MECFKWAIIAAMKWEEIGNNPERICKLKHFEREFVWEGIEYPVSFKNILNKFEKNNEISVNILAIENRKIYICRKGRDYDRNVNLMLIADVENQINNIMLLLNLYRDYFLIKTVNMVCNTFA